MSSQSFSTFQSSSYSSYRDSSGRRYEESALSDPSGTTVHRTTQDAGQPAISKTTHRPADGAAAPQIQGVGGSNPRIEDVTDADVDADADSRYEERINDEYAKREGGA